MNNSSQEAADRFSRMMTKADARLNEVFGGRADLYISDVQPLDRDSCYALINYAQGLPSPTSESVIEFIGAKFKGSVRPVLETAKAFGPQCRSGHAGQVPADPSDR